jgi:RimJ/RimL family protein N-acetyltransferase
MSDLNFRIRKLLPSDARAYREIRPEALASNPEAFGSSFESEAAEPLAWFENRLSSSEVFAAVHEFELLGVAGFYIHQGPKRAHKATLWGMYVCPQARNIAVGSGLAEAVIDAARLHAELIQLSVVSENRAARRLYSRLGFVEFGLEKKALKQGGRYYDEVLMALPLEQNRR